MKNTLYVVFQSIGGWNQNSEFSGTFEECQNYVANGDQRASYGVERADQYQSDYL